MSCGDFPSALPKSAKPGHVELVQTVFEMKDWIYI